MKQIKVWTLMTDGGDGGGNMEVFCSEQERDEAQYSHVDYNWKKGQKPPKFDIEDEYENGYRGEDSIEYEIIDGELKFKPMCFHYGQ